MCWRYADFAVSRQLQTTGTGFQVSIARESTMQERLDDGHSAFDRCHPRTPGCALSITRKRQSQ